MRQTELLAKRGSNHLTAYTAPGSVVAQAGKAFVTASLCAILAVGPAFAEALPGTGAAAGTKPLPKPTQTAPLTEDQRVLHALNRFTFGPRPGDVAAVEKIGLKNWFDQQLNPASIPDPQLDALLAKFPATELTTQESMLDYPSGLMLKRYAFNADKAIPPGMPADYAAVYRVAAMQYQNAANGVGKPNGTSGTVPAPGTAPAPAGMEAANNSDGMMGADPSMSSATPPAVTSPATSPVAPPLKVKNKAIKVKGEARRALHEDYTGPSRESILAMAPDARMQAIISQSAPQIVAFLKGLDTQQRGQLFKNLSPHQMEIVTALAGPSKVIAAEALETRILRDVYSQRQLQAVMTDFWLNHFSVYVRKNQFEPYFLNAYQKNVILPHALGNFEDLLIATAKSEAMEIYLDNYQSTGPNSPAALKYAQKTAANGAATKKTDRGINENYARELMELHTLGVRCEVSGDRSKTQLDKSCGAGYTQTDVINVAKVLTGWTVKKSPSAYAGAGFEFDANRHEPGPKQVLGVTIPAGGEQEGLTLLHMLATSPATAQFISHKLAVRFVSDTPPRALEDRMAKTFLATHGNIAAVLKTMFNSPEMWAPSVYRAKVKTPIEFVASALRASDATTESALAMVQAVDRLGMPIYGMQTPNGYSWNADDWVSTNALVSRMNFALVYSGDLLRGVQPDWTAIVGATAAAAPTPSLVTEHALEMALLGEPASDHTRTVVMEQADRPGQATQASQSFGQLPTQAAPENEGMFDDGKLPPVKNKGNKAAKYDGTQSLSMLAASSGTERPVNTMAGLLLGSPDFQRR